MLIKKVVTVSAGFGAEETSRDFKGMTERDKHPREDVGSHTIAGI